jgi:hypothetical protein
MFFWQVCALGFGFFTRPKHPENATWIKNIPAAGRILY